MDEVQALCGRIRGIVALALDMDEALALWGRIRGNVAGNKKLLVGQLVSPAAGDHEGSMPTMKVRLERMEAF